MISSKFYRSGSWQTISVNRRYKLYPTMPSPLTRLPQPRKDTERPMCTCYRMGDVPRGSGVVEDFKQRHRTASAIALHTLSVIKQSASAPCAPSMGIR